VVPASPSSLGSRRPRSGWVWALLAALPWAWFVLRGSWPPLDLIAVVLPPVGVASLLALGLVAARTGRLLALAAGLSIFLVTVMAVVVPRLPVDQPHPIDAIRLASVNVLAGNDAPREAAAALADRPVDLLVVIEAGRSTLDELRARTDLRERITGSELSVFSRWPLTRLTYPPPPGGALLRIRVDRPGAPFVLLVIHAPNPLYQTTFEEQERLMSALIRRANAEVLPALIVGDLNLTDRAEGYRMLAGSMRDAMRAGSWASDTYQLNVWRLLLLRIDHLFVPARWCAADPVTFDVPGSDHRGIEATIGPCP
jgi:endonuclease/exonuclease/phosphatase (EEP) superfamily protein YafD